MTKIISTLAVAALLLAGFAAPARACKEFDVLRAGVERGIANVSKAIATTKDTVNQAVKAVGEASTAKRNAEAAIKDAKAAEKNVRTALREAEKTKQERRRGDEKGRRGFPAGGGAVRLLPLPPALTPAAEAGRNTKNPAGGIPARGRRFAFGGGDSCGLPRRRGPPAGRGSASVLMAREARGAPPAARPRHRTTFPGGAAKM